MTVSAVLPAVVIAVAAVTIASKVYVCRRAAARLKVSGGRKAFVLNSFDRS